MASSAGGIYGALQSNSSIDNLIAATSIGTSSSPISINCKGDLKILQAQSVYANIDTRWSGGTGGVLSFITTSGPFAGSLNTSFVDGVGTSAGLSIAGNLDANVTVAQSVADSISVAGTFTTGKTLRINGSLTSPLSFPNDGLSGQVIINAGNTGGTWTADVKENNVALSPKPNYGASAASLGGGAVGLVPFRMHATDSEPDDDDTYSYAFHSTSARRFG